MSDTRQDRNLKVHNPFRDLKVTELIEDAHLYRDMFSENILIGETSNIYLPGNVIVLGPQGSGKTMLLNLTRLPVMAEWLRTKRAPPEPLREVPPYFGISINLNRASFHSFGNISVAKALRVEKNPWLESIAAADFVTHFLFNEFIKGIELCCREDNDELRKWLGFDYSCLMDDQLAARIAEWDCWRGFYAGCDTWERLRSRCSKRLDYWKDFLRIKGQEPTWLWNDRPDIEMTMHSLGNLIRELGSGKQSKEKPSLFIYIDQYEEIKALSHKHSSELQRIINTLIKSRDPVVFYRIGARTYDWGTELRISGSESRIEVERDYSIVDLTSILRRREDRVGYIYPKFAADVARKRLERLENMDVSIERFQRVFGKWSAKKESELYYRCDNKKSRARAEDTIRGLPSAIMRQIIEICDNGEPGFALEMRLASAWALQKSQRGWSEGEICAGLSANPRPWHKQWWYKERKEIGLVQLASHAYSQRRYFGWDTLLYLSGGNISAFLYLCSEIWDTAAREGVDPLDEEPLDEKIQTNGIISASTKWQERDRNEPEGSRRYYAINRIGHAIRDSIRRDLALSNPGHTGFSIPKLSLYKEGDDESIRVRTFLHNAVNWAIVEERDHASKNGDGQPRLKYYLHPLISPYFEIPIKRVKEPYYSNLHEVYIWLFGGDEVKFGTDRKRTRLRKDR